MVLWRIRELAPGVIEGRQTWIRLNEAIVVDISLLTTASRQSEGFLAADLGQLANRLTGELLPDWYDEWLVEWREQWRQIRLHALERLARLLTSAGEFEFAIQAALAAIRAEPLRESAHRALIEAHLAEGNTSEAIRHLAQYESLLRHELDIAPSPRLLGLIGDVTHR